MKKITFVLLSLLSIQTQAEILEFNAQVFQDTDGLIKRVPDIDTFPSAKQTFDNIVKQAHAQTLYQYNAPTCQKLGITLQEENIDDGMAQCVKKFTDRCQQMKKQCNDLADRLMKAGQEQYRSGEKQIETCYKKADTCIENITNIITTPLSAETKVVAQWVADFYTQNRNLAQPYSGKLYSNNKEKVSLVENGKVIHTSTIFDFGCAKVYNKDDIYYTLIGTENHEEDKPFTGTHTLQKQEQRDVHIYTLQKYTNGVADGPVYQEKQLMAVVYKPIIYLYPTEETEVSVKAEHPEKFTHTYPKYVDGWHVLAKPNGDLTDLKTGRHLYALYWEGQNTTTQDIKDGFIVKGSDTISFLEEKLAQLGLNEREAEEFIIYWLPKLENNEYNLIHFESIAQQNENMPLDIMPKPDTLIRVLMEYKPLDKKIDLPEQILPPAPARTGFTVVEWGGTELKGDM